jgi:glycine betaine/proline transport system substrate-binding protein
VAALILVSGHGSSNANGRASAGTHSSSAIRYALTSFSDDRASTALATAVLRKAGYKVNDQMLGSIAFDFTALANGYADVFSDAWLPYTHAVYWARYGSKLEKVSKLYTEPVTSGLVVPSYCPTQSINQLNSQASMYDSKIIGIEAGAGEMILTQKVIQDYGLKFTLVAGSEAAMLATLKSAINRHKCVVVTLWRPHSAFALFRIRYLKDPKRLYKPEQAWTVANPSLKKNFPHAYAFFKKFTIPLSDQEKMILQEVNENKTPDVAAAAWMAAHPGKVNEWVKIARP